MPCRLVVLGLAGVLVSVSAARAQTPDAGVDAAPPPPAGPPRAVVAKLWAAQLAPRPAPAQAIGAYASGCLDGGAALPPDGTNYQVMRLTRARSYGHPDLVAYVQRLAVEMRRRRLGPLLVGDLSQARGGPTPTGHRSHQNGLDVDLWYTAPLVATRRRLRPRERETTAAQAVVDLPRQTLTRAWTPRLATLLEVAANDPVVDRIFVHPVVKRELCAHAGPERAWLSRIRPWWGHHDHFHVRLRCPAASTECEALEALSPLDDGCGKGLSWWFSDEPRIAAEKRAKSEAAEPALPALPVRCAELLVPEPRVAKGRARSR